MIIPNDELCYKSIIGKWGDKVLYGCGTIGGLHIVEAHAPNGHREVIGAGSHRAVAKMTARRLHPEVEFTMLEKSQEIDERDVEGLSVFGMPLMDFWEEIINRAQKKLS